MKDVTRRFSEKEIVKFYALFVYASKKSVELEKFKTPSFMIDNALEYFSDIEEYDKAASIKNYFDKNETRIIDFTEEEWELKQILTGKA